MCEKAYILDLFTKDGYVLSFSSNGFDSFTAKSVGIPLVSTYGLSKGKSLKKFLYEADDKKVLKLFCDLFEYFESEYLETDWYKSKIPQYEKCRIIYEREKNGNIIQLKEIKILDHNYINSVLQRAFIEIEDGNFDSALTKARTLVEEVMIDCISDEGVTPTNSGDIKKLYKQVKDLYSMHPSNQADSRIKNLLSGLETIITAISEMRNKASDAHGLGPKRINLEKHHIYLLVNSAATLANFLIGVKIKNQNSNQWN